MSLLQTELVCQLLMHINLYQLWNENILLELSYYPPLDLQLSILCKTSDIRMQTQRGRVQKQIQIIQFSNKALKVFSLTFESLGKKSKIWQGF